MCKSYVFWITSICVYYCYNYNYNYYYYHYYYYYYYYYYLFWYISFRVCLKWSRQSRREKINFTQLSSFVRPVVYRPLNWLKIYHIENRTQCLTFSMYLQVQAVCKYLKSFTWTVCIYLFSLLQLQRMGSKFHPLHLNFALYVLWIEHS